MKGFTGKAGLEKITKKEFEEIMNDFEPIEAPPGPYKLQPEKKGKIYITCCSAWSRLKLNTKIGLNHHHQPPPPPTTNF